MGNDIIVPETSEFDKDVKQFNFEGHSVRAFTDNQGEPWLIASEICEILELVNASQVGSRLDDDERVTIYITDSVGRPRRLLLVNESGLYSLILRSRKTEAKRFKKWVTSEVLPAIRKTGSYVVPKTPAEVALMHAQILVEHEKRLANHETRIDRIEARQTTAEEGFHHFSILAYCNVKRISSPDHNTAQTLGRRAAKLSREKGYSIGKTNDPRYGEVNTYHEDILDAVFGPNL